MMRAQVTRDAGEARGSLDLDAIESVPLPATLKGLPQRAAGVALRDLGELRLSVLEGDLPLPIAVLKKSALEHNNQWMVAFARRANVSLCPHGKTTLAPQLFDQQLRAGCWGITAATATHLRIYRRFGVPRVILANQLIGRANVEIVLDELEADPGFDCYLLIDSIEGLELLRHAAERRGVARPIQALLEVGMPGGRTGVRSREAAVALGTAAKAAAPWVALRGVEAFEGIIHDPDPQVAESAVCALLDRVRELAAVGIADDWFAAGELILTAGGTSYFDLVARGLTGFACGRPTRVVLRSGCYLTHDALHFGPAQARMRERSAELWGAGAGLRNALEVWAYVQSVPEPGRAICGLGKRDISHDMELPQPIAWWRAGTHAVPQEVGAGLRLTALNDQHAYVDATAGSIPWRVGDLVAFGVAHPCTTFDKWPLLYVVEDDYRVTGGIRTFF